MLSVQEVQHIAKLARIGLNDGELVKFQKELALVLEYFEILSEVNVSKVKPKIHAVSLQNVTRQDAASFPNLKESQRLLEMVPKTKDGYVQIKSIL